MAGPNLPPGTTVETIFVDALGNVVAESDDSRTGGEIIITLPDGRRESTIFSLDGTVPAI